MSDALIWVWLAMRCSSGTDTFRRLYEYFGSAEAIYQADSDTLRHLLGARKTECIALEDKSLEGAKRVLDLCAHREIQPIPYSDVAYPRLLRELNDPPCLVYCKGRLPDFEKHPGVAVVGTRHMSEYGKKMAYSMAHDLAAGGATVVSGLALGIDGVAAAGALHANGTTVAVLGGAVDNIYPYEHRYLADRIAERGAIISEYTPGTRAMPQYFPRRNRIISGLCLATVVIEGTLESGALITARHAAAQHRALYAVPANVDAEVGQGTAYLLESGLARAASSAHPLLLDIGLVPAKDFRPFSALRTVGFLMNRELQALGVTAGGPRVQRPRASSGLAADTAHGQTERPSAGLPGHLSDVAQSLKGDERVIYERLAQRGTVFPQDLADSSVPVPRVLAVLTMLEVRHLIETLPGGRVRCVD